MPRNGAGVYSLPPVYEAVTGETIEAQQHNVPLEDIAADLNAPRSVATGGTGGGSATAARENLDVYSKSETETAIDEAIEEAVDTSINKATLKDIPVDDDGFLITDSADTDKFKRVKLSKLKAVLKSFFDPLYQAAGDYLTLAGGTLTGALRLATSLTIRSDANRHLWMSNADGSKTAALIFSNAANNTLEFRAYSMDGASYKPMSYQSDGQLILSVTVPSDDGSLTPKIWVVSQLAGKITRDAILTAGFAGNDVNLPYFCRESDGVVYYLQRRLGYTPIEQGGAGIGTNKINLGWSGSNMHYSVDGGAAAGQFVTNGNLSAWLDNQSVVRQNTTNVYLGQGASGGTGQTCLNANLNQSGTAMTVMDRGTVRGSITLSGVTTSFNTSSDYRLKPVVEPLVDFELSPEQFELLDNSLLRLMAWRPVRHNWVDHPDLFVFGFIAHELQTVSPLAVTGQKDAKEEIGTAVFPGEITPSYSTIEYSEDENGAPVEKEVVIPEKSAPDIVHEGVTQAAFPDAKSWVKTGERPVYQGVDTSKLIPEMAAAVQSLTLLVLDQHRRIADLEARQAI